VWRRAANPRLRPVSWFRECEAVFSLRAIARTSLTPEVVPRRTHLRAVRLRDREDSALVERLELQEEQSVSSAFRGAAIVLVAVFAFTGCGGSTGTTGTLPLGAMTQRRAHKASGSSGDLLYIAGAGVYQGLVAVLTFPQAQPFATITGIPNPHGVCSDSVGNVWVTASGGDIYEFAHGGTTPIAELNTGSSGSAISCSVDPTTGNLAVNSGNGIAIFRDAQGTPTTYSPPFSSWATSYDGQGNLFVDSSQAFQIAELPSGGSTFEIISLNKKGGDNGGLQWDGKYLAVATHKMKNDNAVYRIRISGTTGTVVQVVRLHGLHPETPLSIQGNIIAAVTTRAEMGFWKYPRGGNPTKIFGGNPFPEGITVSVAPSAPRIHK